MGLFKRADKPPVDSSDAALDVGWADIEAVRNEWPQSQLQPDADIRSWSEGLRLYENDDYPSMMRCATLLSAALAHNLYGEGILRGSDLPETVRKVLYASVEAPPDGRTFAESARRCARLALTIVRENGWQPASMGGSGLFDRFIQDKGNYMLYSTAIAGTGEIAGDLKDFFYVTPQTIVAEIPDSRLGVIDDMLDMIQKADSGDEASEFHTRGMALWMNGELSDAMTALKQAARLGDARAMKDTGDLASEMGQDSEARFWFESAANAGDPQAMFNMGALSIQAGDTEAAGAWFQRSVEGGDPEGYAAMTQLADERGDGAGERYWARLGAEAGQGFCIFRHGLYLAMDADGDVPRLRRAVAFLEAAGERGDIDGMMMSGNVNDQLGDAQRARMWFDRARATGDPKALEMLEKYGF